MKSKQPKVLALSKSTIRNLSVQSNIKGGGYGLFSEGSSCTPCCGASCECTARSREFRNQQ
jgi:hypothetical protein